MTLPVEVISLLEKEAIELAPLTPGYYSRIFVVSLVTGGWRPIIDLSALNQLVQVSKFHMETSQSVLQSVRLGDWMVSQLAGCIFAGSGSARISQIPAFQYDQRHLPVPCSLFLPVDDPPGFYQGHGSCVSHSSLEGLSSPTLPGRLAPSGTVPELRPIYLCFICQKFW